MPLNDSRTSLNAQINFYPYFPHIFAYFGDFQWRYSCIVVLIIVNVVNIAVKDIQIQLSIADEYDNFLVSSRVFFRVQTIRRR